MTAGETLKSIAVSLMAQGSYRDALSNLEEAREHAGKLGTQRGVMSFAYTIGYIQLQMGKLEEAGASLATSLQSANAVRQGWHSWLAEYYRWHGWNVRH